MHSSRRFIRPSGLAVLAALALFIVSCAAEQSAQTPPASGGTPPPAQSAPKDSTP